MSSFRDRLNDLLDGRNSPLKRRVTQKELAESIGVSRQVISQYCNGITVPNIETACKIADFFDVGLDNLCNRNSKDLAYSYNDVSVMIGEAKATTKAKIMEALSDYIEEKLKGDINQWLR